MKTPRAALLLVLGVTVFLTACETADKYKKETGEPVVESGAETRELRVEGTPAEMRYAQGLAGGLAAAHSIYDVGDTLGAIAMADSLSLLGEAALDTLAAAHPLNEFMMIYVTDTYGVLREWHARRGDQDALDALGQRYNALATRMQERRDTLTTTP